MERDYLTFEIVLDGLDSHPNTLFWHNNIQPEARERNKNLSWFPNVVNLSFWDNYSFSNFIDDMKSGKHSLFMWYAYPRVGVAGSAKQAICYYFPPDDPYFSNILTIPLMLCDDSGIKYIADMYYVVTPEVISRLERLRDAITAVQTQIDERAKHWWKM